MCNFFSLVSNGDGKALYFDSEIRKKIINKQLKYEKTDSHTSVADYYGYVGEKEDALNKYEYNPLTKVFIIDQLNNKVNDSKAIEKFCNNLDFKTVVPELIIKPIISPFIDIKTEKVTKKDLQLLKEWDSVRASVGDSVGDSVWNSVRDSVGDSVRNSVRDSVWDSVWDSVGDSVWNSVRISVWNSVGDSVWAYISSFFDVKYKYDFTSVIKLWERGLVPSFDDKIWRLHGYKGEILWEEKKK